jgi:hypothetical protein
MNEELVDRLGGRGHPEVRYPHDKVFQYLDDGGTHSTARRRRIRP